MAIRISDNFRINAPRPVRDTDIVGLGQPYSTYAAKEDIPMEMRHPFMKVTDLNGFEWRLDNPLDLTAWVRFDNSGGSTPGITDITWAELVALAGKDVGDMFNVITANPADAIVYGRVQLTAKDRFNYTHPVKYDANDELIEVISIR